MKTKVKPTNREIRKNLKIISDYNKKGLRKKINRFIDKMWRGLPRDVIIAIEFRRENSYFIQIYLFNKAKISIYKRIDLDILKMLENSFSTKYTDTGHKPTGKHLHKVFNIIKKYGKI